MSNRNLAAQWADLNPDIVDDFFEMTGAGEHEFFDNGEFVGHLTLCPSFSIHHGHTLVIYSSIKPSHRNNRPLNKLMMTVAHQEARRLGYRWLSRSKRNGHQTIELTKEA